MNNRDPNPKPPNNISDQEQEGAPWELPWYQVPFFRRLFTAVFPPLGLWLIWANPERTRRQKITGTALTLLYIPVYLACVLAMLNLAGIVDFEFRGGFGPSIVRRKTLPNYVLLEMHRPEKRKPAAPALPQDDRARPTYWTDFRGPRRDGVYDEQPILTNWPAKGPRLLWKQPIGGGYASFAVAEGRAFTIEQRYDQEVVTAYDIETGHELWSHSYPAFFKEWMGGDGPRATPTYHAGLLYSMGAMGDLKCLAAASGKLLWQKNVLSDNNSSNLTYGMANSPLVVDEKLIVLTGRETNGRGVVAYHKLTGDRIWSALDDRQAYVTPLLTTLAGRRQILVVTSKRAVGLSPENGELLWEYPWTVQNNNMISMPVIVGTNKFFISAGYGAGCALVEIVEKDGRFMARQVWRNRNMRNKFNASVLYDNHIYGLDEGVLACIDVTTGKTRWRDGRYGYGQLLLASGHLIVLGGEGELALVRASPDRRHEVARINALSGKTWNVPALSQGLLLVRNCAEMACYDLRPPRPKTAR
ncbi:MAG: PQQ-like beta-propeller repeat protein [Verrucomicrobiae bacterium]|nr:PQQ-like beta-propeller repeat protein [Verrucomicrobiae bacterium]